MFEPLVGPKSLEQRWVCVVIWFEHGVSENLVIKRQGNFGLILLSEGQDEGVVKKDAWAPDLVEDGQCVGYGSNSGRREENTADRVCVQDEASGDHLSMCLIEGI